MSLRPPPLPAKVLARVLRVATFEGRTVLVLAGGLALIEALGRDWYGAVVGSLVAGAGAVELHGAGLLRSGQARGLNWLVRSQLLLLNLILVYVAIQLILLHRHGLNGIFSPEMIDALKAGGVSANDFGLTLVVGMQRIYAAIAALTILYQGGMALYYHRQRAAVRQAIEQAPAQATRATFGTRRPPPLPDKVLARVLRVATFEGRTVLVLAGGLALIEALGRDGYGAVVGSLVAGAGAVELHGVSLLRNGQVRGIRWLVRSQLLLLVIIQIYVAIQLLSLQLQGLKGIFSTAFVDDLPQVAQATGLSVRDLSQQMVQMARGAYLTVAVLTLLYQGGMAWYYHRRGVIIRQALDPAGGGS